MRKVETLTAYRCEFRYRQRNNPMIEQQREAIRKGIVPRYSFSAFIEKYKNFTQDLVIGGNTDRAIALPNEHESSSACPRQKSINFIKVL